MKQILCKLSLVAICLAFAGMVGCAGAEKVPGPRFQDRVEVEYREFNVPGSDIKEGSKRNSYGGVQAYIDDHLKTDLILDDPSTRKGVSSKKYVYDTETILSVKGIPITSTNGPLTPVDGIDTRPGKKFATLDVQRIASFAFAADSKVQNKGVFYIVRPLGDGKFNLEVHSKDAQVPTIGTSNVSEIGIEDVRANLNADEQQPALGDRILATYSILKPKKAKAHNGDSEEGGGGEEGAHESEPIHVEMDTSFKRAGSPIDQEIGSDEGKTVEEFYLKEMIDDVENERLLASFKGDSTSEKRGVYVIREEGHAVKGYERFKLMTADISDEFFGVYDADINVSELGVEFWIYCDDTPGILHVVIKQKKDGATHIGYLNVRKVKFRSTISSNDASPASDEDAAEEK